jgi:hypothetical protein
MVHLNKRHKSPIGFHTVKRCDKYIYIYQYVTAHTQEFVNNDKHPSLTGVFGKLPVAATPGKVNCLALPVCLVMPISHKLIKRQEAARSKRRSDSRRGQPSQS